MSPIIKDIFREIKKSAGRFVSITLLLMLAVGFYSGLRATQPDMQITADKYMDDSGMFDVRIQSSLGLSEADLEAIRALPGVSDAEGAYSIDAIVHAPDSDIIVSLQTLSERRINAPELISGRLPERADECVVERRFLRRMGLEIGDSFHIARVSDTLDDALGVREFTVVGTVRSPLYMSNVQRGVSTLDTGRISSYVLIPRDAVILDYYLEVNALVAGAADAAAYSDDYADAVEPVLDAAKSLADTRLPLRRDELTADARREIEDAEREIAEKSIELEDARREIVDARIKYGDGVTKYREARREADEKLADAERELDDAERRLRDGRAQLSVAERAFEARAAEGEAGFADSKARLEAGMAELAAAWDEYHAGRAELDAKLDEWNALPDAVKETMPEAAAELEAADAVLMAALAELEARQKEIDTGYITYMQGREHYDAEISSALSIFAAERDSLNNAEARVREGRAELETEREQAYRELDDAERELADAYWKIIDGEREIADGEEKLQDGEREIADARRELDDVPQGTWYVQGRGSNYGYANFGQDADKMGALGAIFPIIFFAVAALVCLTTMTRMVDEQRVEIGTFKSLGMHRLATAGKFIVYGGLAAIIGVSLGLALGMTVLPRFIFHAYSALYDLPTLLTPFHYDTVLISVASAFACTLGATALACAAALRETPAGLLRPRAPTPGKRVLLERITPLWRRMSFFGKVSARNVLRYKKRLFMTIAGIAGCTALIVTGIGLRDSIVDLPRKQFEELYRYDLLITVNPSEGEEAMDELNEALAHSELSKLAPSYSFIRSIPADFSAGAQGYSGEIIIPEYQENLGAAIALRGYKDGAALTLPRDGVVITAKLSELLGIRIGDTITLDTGERHDVTVAEIAEQYVNHVVYISREYYESLQNKAWEPNQILIVCSDDEEETASALSSELLALDAVGHAVYFKNEIDGFTRSIGSINSVVLIIIAAAGALAFIVLFNLTNINITERRRELATIKVLGFYDAEVTWYIIRENIFLTAAAIVLGLVAGKYLHNWLIRTVEVDFTMFIRSVKWLSYVIAVLLTSAFAIIVNFVGHLRMKRINMVESLKINE